MKAKFGSKELLEAARRENENMTADEAPALHGDEGAVVVDLCDIRELACEVLIAGAFRAPRGMREFWIEPDRPNHKSVSQGYLRRAKQVRVLLRFQQAPGTRGSNGVTHGARVGCPKPRRLPGVDVDGGPVADGRSPRRGITLPGSETACAEHRERCGASG